MAVCVLTVILNSGRAMALISHGHWDVRHFLINYMYTQNLHICSNYHNQTLLNIKIQKLSFGMKNVLFFCNCEEFSNFLINILFC